MKQWQRKAYVKQLFDKYGRNCFYCGCDLTATTVTIDHFYPISKGGTDHLRNLRPACDVCNKGKSDNIINEFDIIDRNDMITLFLEKSVKYALKMQRNRNEAVTNNVMLSEEQHRQKIETQRHKKIAKHYSELIKMIVKKSGKQSLEELLTTPL